MLNKDEWMSYYNSLDTINQFKVALTIIEEIRANEEAFDEEEYNRSVSTAVHELFDTLINNYDHKDDLQEIQDFLEKFDTLSAFGKSHVIHELLSGIIEALEKRKMSADEKTKSIDNEHNSK